MGFQNLLAGNHPAINRPAVDHTARHRPAINQPHRGNRVEKRPQRNKKPSEVSRVNVSPSTWMQHVQPRPRPLLPPARLRPPSGFMGIVGLPQDRPGSRPRLRLPLGDSLECNSGEFTVRVEKIPPHWTTWELEDFFAGSKNVHHMRIFQRGTFHAHAIVCYRPPPEGVPWQGWIVEGQDYNAVGAWRRIECLPDLQAPHLYHSPNTGRPYPMILSVPLMHVDFGVMQDEDTMQICRSLPPTLNYPADLIVDLQHKEVTITFCLDPTVSTTRQNAAATSYRQYKMCIKLAQIQKAFYISQGPDEMSLVISTELPPEVFRKTRDIKKTHGCDSLFWNERQAWFRQTDIDSNPTARRSPVQLKKDTPLIDIGRWLTYRLRLSTETVQSDEFQAICQVLADHNINIETEKKLAFYPGKPEELWNFLENGAEVSTQTDGKRLFSHVQEMTYYLSFPVRYNLEVCLSLGVLQECNMSKAFIQKLASIDGRKAEKILETVASMGRRFYVPGDIILLQNQVSAADKKIPNYCAKILAATITPTTIYLSTPVPETSNRVVRRFHPYQDRFLRVKFTDEKYKGRLLAQDGRTMDELFSRVKRAMTRGIDIAGRHYEFLAFGNSQFREHGAYFFASLPDGSVTTHMIREWMGNFSNIRVIAKYASRLGQGFSTTHAISQNPHPQLIRDVKCKQNKYCFTDGVGKICPILAQSIATHFKLDPTDPPSVFQFRSGGCKGVLAIDPNVKINAVHIRPSQKKFEALYRGLEICQYSRYSAAHLNMQLILVLSALGVPDEVFIRKLRNMLFDLDEAMHNESIAVELLQKNVDPNEMTLQLAAMVYNGFMEIQEPFLISCLQLWKSWSLKYLKEKARIFIEQGVFEFGCTDETGTLRGYYERPPSDDAWDENSLPEIFLQIPHPNEKGKYKAVEGVCILARNPSLHPGDIRVVRAVNIPALHHLKNCVVMPQNGDRDLANMCSGGDLDGDDFLVIWDKDLIPQEWNHPAMDYTAPEPEVSKGPVTVNDITKFFVTHIKNDNLGRIATAHRYWADSLPDGVKDPKCLELAHLHSQAVDYAKTGVPAEMPKHLRVNRWPHWAEVMNEYGTKNIYRSEKILGKLYDNVQRVPFRPVWEMSFDRRILHACQVTEQSLADAKNVKMLYDAAMRRIMAKHGIKTEFEVVTGFIMAHSQDIGDYKFSEVIGEAQTTLKHHYRAICYEKAGTSPEERDIKKLEPFLVAMYMVTAAEMEIAVAETKMTKVVGGHTIPLREESTESMPFMSFPWIFARELGQIATKGIGKAVALAPPKPTVPSKSTGMDQSIDRLGGESGTMLLPQIDTANGPVTIHEGDLLDLFYEDDQVGSTNIQQQHKFNGVMNTIEREFSAMNVHDLELSAKLSGAAFQTFDQDSFPTDNFPFHVDRPGASVDSISTLMSDTDLSSESSQLEITPGHTTESSATESTRPGQVENFEHEEVGMSGVDEGEDDVMSGLDEEEDVIMADPNSTVLDQLAAFLD